MPRLVAQNAHEPVAIAALHFAHEAPLDAHQSLVGEIERNGDARNPIRREPFLGQPAMRPEAHVRASTISPVQPLDGALQLGARDAQASSRRNADSTICSSDSLSQATGRVRDRRLRFTSRHAPSRVLRRAPPHPLPSSPQCCGGPRGRRSRTALGPQAASRRRCKCWRRSPRCGPGNSCSHSRSMFFTAMRCMLGCEPHSVQGMMGKRACRRVAGDQPLRHVAQRPNHDVAPIFAQQLRRHGL